MSVVSSRHRCNAFNWPFSMDFTFGAIKTNTPRKNNTLFHLCSLQFIPFHIDGKFSFTKYSRKPQKRIKVYCSFQFDNRISVYFFQNNLLLFFVCVWKVLSSVSVIRLLIFQEKNNLIYLSKRWKTHAPQFQHISHPFYLVSVLNSYIIFAVAAAAAVFSKHCLQFSVYACLFVCMSLNICGVDSLVLLHSRI